MFALCDVAAPKMKSCQSAMSKGMKRFSTRNVDLHHNTTIKTGKKKRRRHKKMASNVTTLCVLRTVTIGFVGLCLCVCVCAVTVVRPLARSLARPVIRFYLCIRFISRFCMLMWEPVNQMSDCVSFIIWKLISFVALFFSSPSLFIWQHLKWRNQLKGSDNTHKENPAQMNIECEAFQTNFTMKNYLF